MKLCLAVSVVLMIVPVQAAEQPVPMVAQQDLIVSPVAEPTPAAGRLRIMERRRMGLTPSNIVRVLREMGEAGELQHYVGQAEDGVREIDVSNLSLAVADRLAAENPTGWKDIDWDKVITYIERILELLIKYLPIIIDLFAQVITCPQLVA